MEARGFSFVWYLWVLAHCAAFTRWLCFHTDVSETQVKVCLQWTSTLWFCFLLSAHSDVCRLFNLFTSTCSHCCISLFSLVIICWNCSSLAFHCLQCLVCFSPKLHLCVSFWFHFFMVFPFLKLHQGTRTHAQLPHRPVPPPKPRRSKKGVSRCRLRLSTSPL